MAQELARRIIDAFILASDAAGYLSRVLETLYSMCCRLVDETATVTDADIAQHVTRLIARQVACQEHVVVKRHDDGL